MKLLILQLISNTRAGYDYIFKRKNLVKIKAASGVTRACHLQKSGQMIAMSQENIRPLKNVKFRTMRQAIISQKPPSIKGYTTEPLIDSVSIAT